nr:NADH dehydrogenase subunit 5 [Laomedia astacina]
MMWNVRMYFTSMFFLMIISISCLLSSVMFLTSSLMFLIEWELLTLNSCMIEFTLIFDWMSLMFLSFVTFISAMVLYYSGEYMHGDGNLNRFLYLVLAFVFSMGALICSPNLISILLGWDGLGLVSYALVIYYQNEKSANAGMLTVLSNRVGDVAILLSIALMFSGGNWNFIIYAFYFNDDYIILKGLIMLAAMTKSAQIPFSAWLPAAMAAPTPVSALVHSSTLVTAGVYLLIRFSAMFNNSKIQSLLLIISSLTMFMAGVGANFEYDLKKIIALSTLSQLGVMISILALGFPMLAFFHLLTHALFKALLFMCAGAIIHNMNNYQDIRSMGGLATNMPLTVMCMNLANLALCGAPFLAGFYSKDLILEVAFMSNINFIAFLLYVFATGLTACYTFRLVFLTLTNFLNLGTLYNIHDEAKIMTYPMMMLSLGAVMGGSFLSWLIFPEPYMICMNFFFKSLTLMVVLLGAFSGYILNLMKINYLLKSLKVYFLVTFCGSMWFMPYLSTFMTSYMNLKMAKLIQDSMDKGWSELVGGQGAYKMIMNSAGTLQSVQNNTVKLYMKTFFFWIAILFFISL